MKNLEIYNCAEFEYADRIKDQFIQFFDAITDLEVRLMKLEGEIKYLVLENKNGRKK